MRGAGPARAVRLLHLVSGEDAILVSVGGLEVLHPRRDVLVRASALGDRILNGREV